MNCPPEIADAIPKVLAVGILRIRALAISGDADRYFVEADHIHNLPQLLRDYSRPLLDYYWDVERPAFIARTARDRLAGFEPCWRELHSTMENHGGIAASRS